MIEKLNQAVKALQKNKEFKEFKKKNPKSCLASCVIIIDGKKLGNWQVDYYIPKKHKMATFSIEEKIELKGEDDIFQKEKKEIKKLNLNEVKIDLNNMLNLVEEFRKKHYSGDYPNKIIAVLQNLNDQTVWNITCLTTTLKILNIKINAKDGKIIEDKIENVFSLKSS